MLSLVLIVLAIVFLVISAPPVGEYPGRPWAFWCCVACLLLLIVLPKMH